MFKRISFTILMLNIFRIKANTEDKNYIVSFAIENTKRCVEKYGLNSFKSDKEFNAKTCMDILMMKTAKMAVKAFLILR